MTALGAHLPLWQRYGLLLAVLVDLAFMGYLVWLVLQAGVWLFREMVR